MKLPKGFKITRLGIQRYVLKYTQFNWEPNFIELCNRHSELVNLAFNLKLNLAGYPSSVYVRSGDIAVGIIFKDKRKRKDIERQFEIEIFDGK